MKTNKIIYSIGLFLCMTGMNLLAANTSRGGNAAYDFSPEHSIWGKGPVHPIEPEGADKTAKTDSFITPFDTVDLSKLNMERTIANDIKSIKIDLMRKRSVRQTVPLINDDSHSHLGLSLQGGYSSLLYSSDFGNSNGGFSPGFSIDYLYFFHQRWGARIAIGLSSSKSVFKSSGVYTDQNTYTDYEGDQLKMSYKIASIEETDNTLLLEVPLMACYAYNDWIISAGLKFGFPIHIKYDQDMKGVDITGEYSFAYPITDADAIGAGHWDKINTSGKFEDNSTYIMITGDFGRKFRLGDQFDLGTSLFVDYSLNSVTMRAQNEKSNAQWERNTSDIYNLIKASEIKSEADLPSKQYHASVLCSKQMDSDNRLIDKLNYFNVGLKVTLYFSSYGNYTREAQAEIDRKAALMK